jgi:hypothetical protein
LKLSPLGFLEGWCVRAGQKQRNHGANDYQNPINKSDAPARSWFPKVLKIVAVRKKAHPQEPKWWIAPPMR